MEKSGSTRKRKATPKGAKTTDKTKSTSASGSKVRVASSRSASRGRKAAATVTVAATATATAATPAATAKSTLIEMKFAVGDDVMTKYPGTSLFYPSKVVYVRPEDREYDIRFENEKVFTLPSTDVKAEIRKKPEQSPHRSRSRSRGRSPARKARTTQATATEPARKATPASRTPAVSTRASERVAAKAGAVKEAPKVSFYWLAILVCALASPAVLVALHSVCSKSACKIEWPLTKIPKTVAAYVDQEALLGVEAFVVGLFLLSALPIGREVAGPSGQKARATGWLLLLLALSGALGLHFKGIDVSAASEKYFLVVSSGILVAFALSLFAYLLALVRGEGDNPKGNTGNVVLDFFYGKALDPTFLKVDLKLFARRLSLTGVAVLNVLLLLASIKKKGAYNLGASVAVSLQVLYALDGLIFEGNFYSSYTALNSGFGYSFISTQMFLPFLSTLITRYIISRGPAPNNVVEGLAVAIFLVGLVLHRRSELQAGETSQKYKRINTAGGIWNFIRYPNYLGQILIYWSWVLPAVCIAGTTDLLIYFFPLVSTMCIILRIRKENVRNSNRHGSAWNTYSKRVTANLIPKVF